MFSTAALTLQGMTAVSRINPNVKMLNITKTEFQTAVDWAQTEGWIPGIHDIDSFYDTDPTGFYAAKIGGEIVGTFSVVKYSKELCVCGFLYCSPRHAGHRCWAWQYSTS